MSRYNRNKETRSVRYRLAGNLGNPIVSLRETNILLLSLEYLVYLYRTFHFAKYNPAIKLNRRITQMKLVIVNSCEYSGVFSIINNCRIITPHICEINEINFRQLEQCRLGTHIYISRVTLNNLNFNCDLHPYEIRMMQKKHNISRFCVRLASQFSPVS